MNFLDSGNPSVGADEAGGGVIIMLYQAVFLGQITQSLVVVAGPLLGVQQALLRAYT